VDDPRHSLQLAQFTRKGFQSVEAIGGINRGIPFALSDRQSVAVFVRQAQNSLYRRMIVDDEILSAHDVASVVTGDPSCYIHEFSFNRQLYCFARNSAGGLSEHTEVSTNTWRVTQLGSPSDRLRDESAPMCSRVGSMHRYCFAVLDTGRISRILFQAGQWSSWQSIAQQSFTQSPLLVTAQTTNTSDINQTCYLLAIDPSNHLQVSMNTDCARSNLFTNWTPLVATVRFKQFDKIFRLRDGNIGVLGVDSEDQPSYLFLDRKTHRFSTARLALTEKPEKFRV
jgi:hypothetical protein